MMTPTSKKRSSLKITGSNQFGWIAVAEDFRVFECSAPELLSDVCLSCAISSLD